MQISQNQYLFSSLIFVIPEERETARESTGSPDLGGLSDFHQLILLRMLRPDRLPIAMARYVNKHLSLDLQDETTSAADQVRFSSVDLQYTLIA